jgi:hypothetical protein
MNTMRTARVLIIDDRPDEAMPVVQALGTLGIGCVYVSGEKIEDVERLKPFAGIRIAFVDMKLAIEGTAREVVAKTVRVLKAVLSNKTLPIVLIAWTDHPEYVEEFTRVTKQELPFIVPLLIHRMQKPKRADGGISLAKVISGLRRILNAHWPLSVMWALEQIGHEATSNTTQAVSEVASQGAANNGDSTDTARADNWLRSLQRLLRTLIFAAAGSNLDRRESQVGLLEAFSAMHFERLQNISFPALITQISKLCRLEVPRLSVEQTAALNSMLLLSPVDASERTVKPGNLYVRKANLKLRCPVVRAGLTAANLTSLMPALKFTKDPQWKKLDEDASAAERKNESAKAARARKAGAARRQAILRTCLPALLELTPPCDYAQRKSGAARFMAGLLVPGIHAKIFESCNAAFLRKIEPLILPGKAGTWQLILNVRGLYTISNPDKKIASAAIARLRTSIQSEILAWFGSHASRPGYLSVR